MTGGSRPTRMVGGEVFQMWLATLSRPEGSARSLPSKPPRQSSNSPFRTAHTTISCFESTPSFIWMV